MIRFEQCDPVLSAVIREEALYLFEHEPSRFIDRGVRFVNLGVAGDRGHYYSLRHDAAPQDVREWLGLLAQKLPDLTLDQAYINVYPPGGFIPIHRDNTAEGHLAMAIVALQSNPHQGLQWFEDGDLRQEHFIPDELGQASIFDSLATLHAVPAVTEPRLSIVYLYR